MATETLQVMCVTQRPHHDPYERVGFIGGVKPDGSRWRLAELQAIVAIQAGTMHFFVTGGGTTTRVIVDHHKGRAYLKTMDDGETPDTLLSLPECPP